MEDFRIYPKNENYVVYRDGRIFSKKQEKFLEPKDTNDGYKRLQIWKDGKATYMMIHRIVAETFLENPENLKYVNHKDGNKGNNSADNLEWCTQKHNIVHSWQSGLHGNTRIYSVDDAGNKVFYETIREAEKEYGCVGQGAISIAIKLKKKFRNKVWFFKCDGYRKRKFKEKIIATNGIETLTFDSQRDAMKHFGVCQAAISKATRFGMTVKGFRFRYEDSDFVERDTKMFDENEKYRKNSIKYLCSSGESAKKVCERVGVKYITFQQNIKRFGNTKTVDEIIEMLIEKKQRKESIDAATKI